MKFISIYRPGEIAKSLINLLLPTMSLLAIEKCNFFRIVQFFKKMFNWLNIELVKQNIKQNVHSFYPMQTFAKPIAM
jgi:hypothetical protein